KLNSGSFFRTGVLLLTLTFKLSLWRNLAEYWARRILHTQLFTTFANAITDSYAICVAFFPAHNFYICDDCD
ncbi:MAG: hypothetical protein SCM11_08165, partial [Bacillota bacterium]|nr:hypothetical protein [Bacillota bacterium]